jgi:hypothetical protein
MPSFSHGGRVAHGEHTRVTDDLIMGRFFRRAGEFQKWDHAGGRVVGWMIAAPAGGSQTLPQWHAESLARAATLARWLWIVSDVWRRGGALAETIQGVRPESSF